MEIVEEIRGNGNRYVVKINNIEIKVIDIKRVKRRRWNKDYLLLIDSKGRVIEKVFIYLNYKCNIKSINSREQAQSALKLLYEFKEIIGEELEDFTRSDLRNLSDFILGISITGNSKSIKHAKTRSISTHNLYFSAIRRFCIYMGIENKYLYDTINVFTENRKQVELKYKTNLNRNSSFIDTAPKYISVNEYKKILGYLEKNKESLYVRRDMIMVKLMFLYGLRLGEVLGLTIEDIKENKIILCNRISDREYQKAKTCFTPKEKEDYKSKMYKLKDRGFHEIYVSEELKAEILEYIDDSRDILTVSEIKLKNIMENSIADSVIKGSQINYYLFLNKNGSRLSASGWNKRLKKIYLECDIVIDEGTKRINLSHRFRHGYAMNLRRIGRDSLFIKRKLRQRSLSSTEKYFNPTEEDVLIENEAIIKLIEKSMEDK